MVLLAGAIVTAWVPGALASPALWMLAGIVALALVPLVNGSALALKGWRMPVLALAAFAVALGYFSLHLLSGAWLRLPMQMPLVGLCVFGALAFAALFWLQSLIRIAPHSPLAQRLYPWLYGGFFLDETFNAMTFRVWPPAKRPMRPNAQGLPVANALSTISGVQT
jgi:NAD(P)H-quinone oxidoreductase subunit 5